MIIIDLTKKKNDVVLPMVKLLNNKIVLSSECVKLMKITQDDRISINYIQESNEIMFPVIGKSEEFGDKLLGNKITKLNSVSFRGLQNETLSKYGNLFKVEQYNNGIFKMIPINNNI